MVQPDVEWDERLFDSIKTALRSIKDVKRNVDSRSNKKAWQSKKKLRSKKGRKNSREEAQKS